MRYFAFFCLAGASLTVGGLAHAGITPDSAEAALRRALDAVAARQVNGGWGHGYTRDGAVMWGEHTPKAKGWVTVQPPGTPTVGGVFLRAARLLGEPEHMSVARNARDALLAIQAPAGGFPHERDPEAGPGEYSTFDDDTTTAALRFLLAWWEHTRAEVDWREVMKVGELILNAQYAESGGWPQSYPPPTGYGRHITFNDNNIERIIEALLDLYARTGKERFLAAAKKGGECILRLQGGPGEAVWAQQYDQETLAPVWARKFEPPGYTPAESVGVCNTLVELYLVTGEERFLEPLPRAFEWYDTHRLENGKWARLYEPGTQRPVYGRRDKAEKVYDFEEACSGYGWQGEWYPHEAKRAYERIGEVGREAYVAERKRARRRAFAEVEAAAEAALAALGDGDEWLRQPSATELTYYRKYGVPERVAFVDMGAFTRNAQALLDYLEAARDEALP